MKRERVTIHDIAKMLNITASTVSRALKNHPRISEETKKEVQKVALKLNYQPNHIAAALRNGKSNILGIIVPWADRSFFSSAIRGIEEIANRSNYNVMICQTYEDPNKEIGSVEALLNARVDGIIVSHSKNALNFDHLFKIKERGIPLILFDRSKEELEVSHVVIDDFLGAYKATEHLIQQGCKRIAHFTNIKKISIYKERLRGYREALLNNGLLYDESLVVESDLQLEDGRNSMIHLLKLKDIPDAVFSASAYAILGALLVLKEHGIKIPDEVALVGFANESLMSFTEPSLSTVEQHSMRIGNAAAEIFLDEVLESSKKSGAIKKFIPQKIVLTPELIIRQSSLKKPI
ncbi:MAG: LacI family DNA-binding transcriptional regulator [Bacteroidia bacterium]|nr:LacI family DNA-binding transcriptional regulator [Bacteroidia bacterium]